MLDPRKLFEKSSAVTCACKIRGIFLRLANCETARLPGPKRLQWTTSILDEFNAILFLESHGSKTTSISVNFKALR